MLLLLLFSDGVGWSIGWEWIRHIYPNDMQRLAACFLYNLLLRAVLSDLLIGYLCPSITVKLVNMINNGV